MPSEGTRYALINPSLTPLAGKSPGLQRGIYPTLSFIARKYSNDGSGFVGNIGIIGSWSGLTGTQETDRTVGRCERKLDF